MRTHLRLFVGLVVLVFATTFAKAQWSEIPSLPTMLRFPMTAELGGKIYVFGGQGSRDAYSYTPGAAEWVKLPNQMPKAKWSGYAGVIGGKIYIAGGFVTSGTTSTVNAETYEFDPVAETFTQKKVMSAALRVAYFGGAVIGDRLFAIGGYNSGDKTTIQIYDPATDTWTLSDTESPYTGRLPATAVLDGKIYLMGGLTNVAYLSEAWRGTPNLTDGTIAWEAIANLPVQMCRASAGVSNGKVVITGGFPLSTDGYSTTYVYNEANDEWETSYGLPAVTTDAGQLFGPANDLYYVGGLTNQSFKFTYSAVEKPSAVVDAAPIFYNLASGKAAISSFTVRNLGLAPLSVTVAIPGTASAWLTTAQANGSVDALAAETFSLNLFAGTLAPGVYKADVTVTTNDEANASTIIPVMLYVLPEGIIAQPTRVVVEEGTGDWCQYCPQGHDVLRQLHDAFEENVIILSYHGGSASEPMMITDGQNILNLLDIGGYPNASIQRWMFDGEPVQMTNRGSWLDYTQQVLDNQPTAAANITVVSQSYDATTNMFKAKVEIELNQAVPDAEGALRLTTIVTENGIIWKQQDVSVLYEEYEHNEVVRCVYPNPYGTTLEVPPGSVSEGLIVPKTKITQEIEFNVNSDIPASKPTWKLKDPANAFVTFLVHGVNGTRLTPILHAAQLPLTTQLSVQTGTTASTVSVSNYPNPVAKSATFTYSVTEPSVVSLAVYDVMGREVATVIPNEQHSVGTFEANFNASNLLNGTYTVVLTAGAQKATATMIVQK